ncbi:endolytic transglycosylase MltG [Thermodesulfobacteriota bacterium]
MSDISPKRLILLLTGLLFVAAIFTFLGGGIFLISPADESGEEQIVVITEGLSLKGVAQKLEEKGLIRNRTLFWLWARTMGYARNIKSGEYVMSARLPPVKILEKLTRGGVMTHPVTIPEGLTRRQIADLLAVKGLGDKEQFLALTRDPALAKKYGIPGETLEGYIYPDTYHFARGLSARAVIETMINRFWQLVEPLKERAGEINMDIGEVIILASIVEKETGKSEERPVIASVFLNRLKRRMRLDSDPTVIYGLDNFDGNLTRKDLAKPTPYNTYLIRGLPPGPIANPGIASIKAVLYPARTDYLFFVSKNDGSHYFSKTLAEHNKAVWKYQKRRSKRRKKS